MDHNAQKWIRCSNRNCMIRFAKEYYSIGMSEMSELPINEKDKFHVILEGIVSTRLFCMNCSNTHAEIICLNSKIPVEK